MNWIELVIFGMLGVGQLYWADQTRKSRRQVEKLQVQLNVLRTRQGKISSERASRSAPKVDSIARTIIRDSDDLPKTGRMAVGLHRKRVDHGSVNHDRKLPES